ncbi:nuclear transport factor 2 family protein [Desulfotalea psychrophila]|uniref:SnoaL-like domain-containing protein n=1 Tax=Desulfotalea psychrophila (strain LSv54 / DSM 12343) TaxID=177439 RepID=Q6APX6_DESPS|nr:nuclear transport factor 2 family protein [Desulfotalea psychrophila]CAG35597.1 conserved hypothetical protein [Desulfotalea psychrophila LSv54]
MLTREDVRSLFEHLKSDPDQFFAHVATDVQWTVMGTHPLAGIYQSKEDFLDHTFKRLAKILKEGALLEIVDLFIDGSTAIVEMRSISTANNGKPFDNRYCWIVTFSGDLITAVKAYLDSALVQQLVSENE